MLPLGLLFKNSAEIASLTQRSQRISHAQTAWQKVVPEAFANHTQAGDVQHKRLTVYTYHGAIAAKIKQMLPSLLTQLQKQGLEVTSIRVVVQVKSFTQPSKKPHRIISKQGSSALKEMANQLEGTALGESLKRLSSRT